MSDTPIQTREIRAPISIGELIDKISILEIKAERIADRTKRRNVEAELEILNGIRRAAGLDVAELKPLSDELKSINIRLWDIENEIRELEAKQDFGERFVALARSVYQTNDRRARIKQVINRMYGSRIVEEKSYPGW